MPSPHWVNSPAVSEEEVGIGGSVELAVVGENVREDIVVSVIWYIHVYEEIQWVTNVSLYTLYSVINILTYSRACLYLISF